MSPGAVLPAGGHVHSEWSWDAYVGSMERTCARAVELGLPAVAFTEPHGFGMAAATCGPPEHAKGEAATRSTST